MVDRTWIRPDWPAPGSVRSLVTTRSGGQSGAGSRGPYASFNLGAHVGDDVHAVLENRRRLHKHLPAEPLWLRQVHGTHVVAAERSGPEPEADAAVAHSTGPVLAVLTADCLPVLLCDRAGSTVGIAHAGWRGLAAGVIENTVEAMGRPSGELLAYLGPAIGPSAYEVGEDVRRSFVGMDPADEEAFAPRGGGKFLADLYRLARHRLLKAGIMAVFGGRHCTYREQALFYSYRRDGATGRMASLIWLDA